MMLTCVSISNKSSKVPSKRRFIVRKPHEKGFIVNFTEKLETKYSSSDTKRLVHVKIACYLIGGVIPRRAAFIDIDNHCVDRLVKFSCS